ncbi:uncharacterized protein LOC131443802 isoform X2 [Solea solea]|uniref:uncharacterized protein LOC131443802 isoform X2 n=1 Tax=Solea solea TaxID=90069 RepID=UPI00272BF99F|nr:uncharacterized protein LOC131443802 isoform X2 [Solea solea]
MQVKLKKEENTHTLRMETERKSSHDRKRHRMSRLEIIFMFVLQFQGITGESVSLFHRPGHEALLPCDTWSANGPSCSRIHWLHADRQLQTATLVEKGNVVKKRVQAARLHLKANCSLLISNVTAEDAGQYGCRLNGHPISDQSVFLNILTISPLEPDPELKSSGDMMLQCSLLSSAGFSCGEKNFHWLDEAGNALFGESVDHRDECVSYLTVSRHQNTRYTCQFVDKNNEVKIEGDYTLVSKGNKRFQDHLHVIVGVAVALVLVLLLVVGAVVLIKCRERSKRKDGLQTAIHLHEETETDVTYTTVTHISQSAPPVKKGKEEESVTYSTVKSLVKAEVGDASL